MIFPKGVAPIRVEYEDRYLSTPIACALLVDVISAVKAFFQVEGIWDDIHIQVTTMIIEEGKSSRNKGTWWSDWERTNQRDEALQATFDYCGINASVISKEKRHLIHGRRISLNFDNDKKLMIWLDQGWSYWTIAQEHRQTALAIFNSHLPPSTLGEILAEFRVDIQGHEVPTQIFVDRCID